MNDYFITKHELTVCEPYAHSVVFKLKMKQDPELIYDIQYMAKYQKDKKLFNEFFKLKYNVDDMYSHVEGYQKDIRFIYLPIGYRFNIDYFKAQNKNLIDKIEFKYNAKLSDVSLQFMYDVFNYCLPSKFDQEYNVTYDEFLFFCFYVGRIPCFNDDYLQFQSDIGNQPVDLNLHNTLSEPIRQYHIHMEEFWMAIHKAC